MDRRAHRLAWLYMHGEYPTRHLDHINGIKSDNRAVNLRLASPSENQQNQSARKRNTSGRLGVSLHTPSGRWVAQITHNYKRVYIGLFGTVDEAYQAYLRVKAELHTFNTNPREEACAT
jgi:hypothetical protein